jgi:hypothetical protein
MRPADTSPEAWKFYLELHRQLTPGERLQRAIQYSTSIRNLAEAGLREQYPEADEREIFLRSARQRLGRELFCKVYGDELKDD